MVVLLLAAIAFAGSSWYRRLPENCFQAAMQAIPGNEFPVLKDALDRLRVAPGYEPHAHLLRAFLLLRAREFQEASKDFPFAFDHPDTRLMARVLAGECWCQQQKYSEATRVLREATVIDPDNVLAFQWLASALFDQGAYEDARICLVRVVELAPDDARAHWRLAQIASMRGEYPEAAEELQQALRCNVSEQHRRKLSQNLARMQIKARRYRLALEALAHCSKTPGTLTMQAECYAGQGQTAKAQATLDQALQLAPAHLGALSLQGKIYLESGDARAAARVLARAATRNTRDVQIHRNLAAAYRKLGDLQAAAEQDKRSSEMQQQNARFARLIRQAAAELENADVRYELGVLAQGWREMDQAKRWFSAALDLDPTLSKARIALMRLRDIR